MCTKFQISPQVITNLAPKPFNFYSMSSSSAIKLPHLPGYLVYALLFKDVKNAAFLRQQLIAGNAEFEYAFLDATKVLELQLQTTSRKLTSDQILSVNHALAAVFRAVNDKMHSRLKSRNWHSEIVFSLSPNNNVRHSFAAFDPSSFCCFVEPPLCIRMDRHSYRWPAKFERSEEQEVPPHSLLLRYADMRVFSTAYIPIIQV